MENKSAHTYLVSPQKLTFTLNKLDEVNVLISKEPCRVKFWLSQGLALSSLGEYKRAEEAHMKAIQIDQIFLEAWTHLTQVSFNIQLSV